jgi:UDP-N-acetylmuramate--alanine ligase
MVFAMAKPGDFVVCLGAGNITQWAAALPAELTALQQRRVSGSAA